MEDLVDKTVATFKLGEFKEMVKNSSASAMASFMMVTKLQDKLSIALPTENTILFDTGL